MALLGPDIDSTLQTQVDACSTVSGGMCTNEYNPCQVLFNIVDNSQLNVGYKKFIDLNCASKTNSLMCEMIGTNLSFLFLFFLFHTLCVPAFPIRHNDLFIYSPSNDKMS